MSEVNASWNDEEMARAIQEVLRRVWVDEDFKKLALTDGAAAVARVDPKPLPPGVVLKFVDNKGPMITLPLPPPVFESEEISEEELEAVAGGQVTVTIYCGCGSVAWSS